MKIIYKLITIIGIIWIFLFFSTNLFFSIKKLQPADTIKYYCDIFYFNEVMIVTTVQGSGSYIGIDFYSKDDQSQIIELYKLDTEESFQKLIDMQLISNFNSELISDGTFFIADIDADDSLEIVRYSDLSYKVAKNIIQITETGNIENETSIISILLIQLICFFRNIYSFFITCFVIIIEFITISIYFVNKKRVKLND